MRFKSLLNLRLDVPTSRLERGFIIWLENSWDLFICIFMICIGLMPKQHIICENYNWLPVLTAPLSLSQLLLQQQNPDRWADRQNEQTEITTKKV